jgi:hypothetical protein
MKLQANYVPFATTYSSLKNSGLLLKNVFLHNVTKNAIHLWL